MKINEATTEIYKVVVSSNPYQASRSRWFCFDKVTKGQNKWTAIIEDCLTFEQAQQVMLNLYSRVVDRHRGLKVKDWEQAMNEYPEDCYGSAGVNEDGTWYFSEDGYMFDTIAVGIKDSQFEGISTIAWGRLNDMLEGNGLSIESEDLSVNKGHDGKTYAWYYDGSKNFAVEFLSGVVLEDDELDGILGD